MSDLTAQSQGAGVQSTTIILLAIEGVLPKPDVGIFADTGWEPRAVYEHLDRLEVVMAEAGIPLLRVSKGNLRADMIDPNSRYASVPYFVIGPCPMCDATGQVIDLRLGGAFSDEKTIERLRRWTKTAKLISHLAFPRWTGKCPGCDGSGQIDGMGRRQCTSEYKLGPINRKVRELLGATPPDFRRVPKGRVCEQWIGFSTDEIHRVSDNDRVSYIRKAYPLLDLGMSRKDCERWLAARGWSTTKSACIGCPYHGNRQWRELRDTCECGHSRRAHRYDDGSGYCTAVVSAGLAVNLIDNGTACDCPQFNAPEWDDAVSFDVAIRQGARGGTGGQLNGEAYLHRSRLPLAEAPIDRVTRVEWKERQGDIFDEVEDGDPDGCSPFGCRSGPPAGAGAA